MQPFAFSGFGWVGVWSGVGEPVAVGRSAAEEAAFDGGLSGHGGADADFDPVAFALAHPAEDGHDQVVSFGFRLDRAADLRYPQADAVVDEDGEGQAVLVAVEGALGFADDDGIEPAVGAAHRRQQPGRFGPAFPGDRAGLPDVEVLGDDLAVLVDQRLRPGQLPVSGRLRILLVLGGDPAVESEPHDHFSLSASSSNCSNAAATPRDNCGGDVGSSTAGATSSRRRPGRGRLPAASWRVGGRERQGAELDRGEVFGEVVMSAPGSSRCRDRPRHRRSGQSGSTRSGRLRRRASRRQTPPEERQGDTAIPNRKDRLVRSRSRLTSGYRRRAIAR